MYNQDASIGPNVRVSTYDPSCKVGIQVNQLHAMSTFWHSKKGKGYKLSSKVCCRQCCIVRFKYVGESLGILLQYIYKYTNHKQYRVCFTCTLCINQFKYNIHTCVLSDVENN